MKHCDYNRVRKAINNTKCHVYTKTFRGQAKAQVASCQPLTVESKSDSRQILLGHVTEKVTLGQAFIKVLWFYPVTFHSTNDPQPLTDLLLMLHNRSK
jgi:hypothetical protein